MPVSFTCPHCGATTKVADEYVGQSGPCASCGRTILVPHPAAGKPGKPASSQSGSSTGLAVVALAVIGGGAALLLCAGVFAALLLPAVGAARAAAHRAACQNQLRQIGLAFHNYHDTFKAFPASFVPDENGRPMHSWRVSLLPFVEQNQIAQMYNFDYPWDHPVNAAAVDSDVPIYRCPAGDEPTLMTNYIAVRGPKTVFEDGQWLTFADIHDGTSNTVLLIELPGLNIRWAEPKDLTVKEITEVLHDLIDGRRTPPHSQGTNVLFADGSVQFLTWQELLAQLDRLATRSGGEAISIAN